MITKISIENFKGIGERVTIPIRPITLLFGPNSGGKSTIMHALDYARVILEERHPDFDRTAAGIRLGGFREMVHRHETDRCITLRFDLDFSGVVSWDDLFPVDPIFLGNEVIFDTATSTTCMKPDTGWVELMIGIYEQYPEEGMGVLSYSVGLGGHHLAELTAESRRDPQGCPVLELNIHHPLLAWSSSRGHSFGPVDYCFPSFLTCAETVYLGAHKTLSNLEAEMLDVPFPSGFELRVMRPLSEFQPDSIRQGVFRRTAGVGLLYVGRQRESGYISPFAILCPARDLEDNVSYFTRGDACDEVGLPKQCDALPFLDQQLNMDLPKCRFDDDCSDSSALTNCRDSRTFVQQLLTRLIVGPGRLLRNYLQRFRYVGPLREVPPPDHAPVYAHDPSRWATGLAAWDLLTGGDWSNEIGDWPKIVSDWLWNEDRLNTGYQLVIKRVLEIENDVLDRLRGVEMEQAIHEMLNEYKSLPGRIYLRDVERGVDLPASSVGLGISQVIPVIVAALQHRAIVQLEQPELHLHPTQQAAVGDLLIVGALGYREEARDDTDFAMKVILERNWGFCHNTLLIETHSVHLILRILRRIRQTHQGKPHNGIPVTPDDVIALYVEPRDGQTTVFEIAIGEDGEFLQPWPDKFFDQDYEERYG